jgi:tetratricopeptide (TPR) repeat protein
MRALAIYRKQKGGDGTDIAGAMVTLANSDIGQHHLDEAERRLKAALEIEARVGGPDGHDVADSLLGLARVDRERGRYDEAREKLKRALAILQRRGEDHPDVADCRRELGDVMQARGENAEAEAEYRKALFIWAKAGLPDHPRAADVLVGYAKLVRRFGRADEAREMEDRTRAIRAKLSAKSG